MKTRTIYRSAKTGRLVSKDYALANPDTTVKETMELRDDLKSAAAIAGIKELIAEIKSTKMAAEDRSHDIEVLTSLVE